MMNDQHRRLIKRLESLREQGLLTDGEFERQRQALNRDTEAANLLKTDQVPRQRRYGWLWAVLVGLISLAAFLVISVIRSDSDETAESSDALAEVTTGTTSESVVQTTSTAVPTTRPLAATSTTRVPPTATVPSQPPIIYDLPAGNSVCSSEEAARFMQGVLIKNGRQVVVSGSCGTQTNRALSAFRSELGLSSDPVVDNQFWLRIFGYPEDSERALGIGTVDPLEAPGGALLPGEAVLWRSQRHQVGSDLVLEQLYVIPFRTSPVQVAEWLTSTQKTARSPGNKWEIPDWAPTTILDGETDVVGFYDHLRIGDCFDFPDESFAWAEEKPCHQPHDAQLLIPWTSVPRWVMGLDHYPSDDEWGRLHEEVCWAAADDFKPTWRDDRENLYVELLKTIEEEWWGPERGLLCAFSARDLSPLTERIYPNSTSDPLPDPPDFVSVTAAFRLDTPEGELTVGVLDNGPGRVDIGLRLVVAVGETKTDTEAGSVPPTTLPPTTTIPCPTGETIVVEVASWSYQQGLVDPNVPSSEQKFRVEAVYQITNPAPYPALVSFASEATADLGSRALRTINATPLMVPALSVVTLANSVWVYSNDPSLIGVELGEVSTSYDC